MTVETFNPEISPNKSAITVSEKALEHFSAKLAKSGKKGILLSLRESGCTGYKYEIEERDEFDPTSHQLVEGSQLLVYFDKRFAQAFSGTLIDYEQQGLNFQLVLKNPNVQDSCGCGESFNFS